MNRRKFIYNSSLASLSVMGLNSCNLNSRDLKITILHTNDVHSQIDPFPSDHNLYPNKGGFAKRASLFEELISINPNTLIFDAGDIFQGTPYFNFFEGELELNLMKKMGYNAATIGNHEFDAGLKTFKKNILNNDFQFISSNYDFTNTELEGLIDKYKIYNKGGIKIGVFGLGIELKGLVNPLLYGETKYYDPVDIAKDISSKLKTEKGCDLVICISHLGHQYQNEKISDTELAKLTSNIDLIIGGHTHTFMKKPVEVENLVGEKVMINQVGCFGINIGKIDFYLSNKIIYEMNNSIKV